MCAIFSRFSPGLKHGPRRRNVQVHRESGPVGNRRQGEEVWLAFFHAENICREVSRRNCAQESQASHEATVPGLHDHLGRGWSGTNAPNVRTSLQQRQRQSPSAAARQDRAPSEQARQSCASAKWWRFMPRLSLGKLTEETASRKTNDRQSSEANTTSLALPWRPSTQDTPTLSVGGHATEPLQPQLGFSGETRVVSRASRGTMASRPPQLPSDERPPGLVAQRSKSSPSRSS